LALSFAELRGRTHPLAKLFARGPCHDCVDAERLAYPALGHAGFCQDEVMLDGADTNALPHQTPEARRVPGLLLRSALLRHEQRGRANSV